MGRRLPFEANPSIHPVLSLSLFATWVTIIIAVIAALCSARPRKPTTEKTSQPSSPSQEQTPENPQEETTPSLPLPLPLPLPPALMKPTEMTHQSQPSLAEAKDPPNNQRILRPSNTTTARRNLVVSLSMKLPRALSSRIWTGKDEYHQHKVGDKQGDSLCTKTIILGERCRVPRGDGDDIIYDETGNRIAAYPSRTTSSLPVSRSNSYIDRNEVPVLNP